MIKRPEPIDEEILFDGRSLISETDKKGVITFINRKFAEMTGYSSREVVGEPHSVLRHPDMPKAAFAGMWDILKDGKTWEGYVKNLRKDGRYYWVVVTIVPKKDDNGDVVGYMASRKKPNRRKLKMIIEQYAKMLEDENS